MKIGIVGSKGRMGQTLMDEVFKTEGVVLAGGIDQGDNYEAFIANCDAIIDFTAPEASLNFAWEAAKYNKIHVIGTTGFSNEDIAKLRQYSAEAKIFWSPNMSIGVNLVAMLTAQAATLLDDSYDIEILEMHHKHKVDSPSGTALLLGEAASAGRGVQFVRDVKHDRNGARVPGEIGYAVLRGGSVIGDHTVIFAGENDRIEITHKSSSRNIYARGAIRAARWLEARNFGFYTMQDMLRF